MRIATGHGSFTAIRRPTRWRGPADRRTGPGRRRWPDLLHVANYREPKTYAGRRVIVVGAGNSAIQVAHELAEHAEVTLASLEPVHFLPQRPHGQDIHHWTHTTGFDLLPPSWLARLVTLGREPAARLADQSWRTEKAIRECTRSAFQEPAR